MEATVKNYELIHADTKYYTLKIWAVVLLLSLINDLDVLLHGFMLQTFIPRFSELNG